MTKIVVIGAGLCGLTTIKELVEAGHEVVCFEKGIEYHSPDLASRPPKFRARGGSLTR